jgi:hypothetical protein
MWVRNAEALVQLERRLPDLLEDQDKPANNAERLVLAQLCQKRFKKLYTASCRFYAEAFARDAKLN